MAPYKALLDLEREFFQAMDGAEIGAVHQVDIDDVVEKFDAADVLGITEYPCWIELHAYGADAYLYQGSSEIVSEEWQFPNPAYVLQAGERTIRKINSAASAYWATKRVTATNGSLIVSATKI